MKEREDMVACMGRDEDDDATATREDDSTDAGQRGERREQRLQPQTRKKQRAKRSHHESSFLSPTLV